MIYDIIQKIIEHLPFKEAYRIARNHDLKITSDTLKRKFMDALRYHDATLDNQFALRSIITQEKNPKNLESLLTNPTVDPAFDNNWAIRTAAAYGKQDIFEKLLVDTRVNPADKNNKAIRFASDNGQTEIVKDLLKDQRVNPAALHNEAIRSASRNGDTDIVKLWFALAAASIMSLCFKYGS